MQTNLFGEPISKNNGKTYRAIRHDVVRDKQADNADVAHHPQRKSQQIKLSLNGMIGLNILELFSGRGNLTKLYSEYGNVEAYDRKYLATGDSYLVYHRLISERKVFDVIDLDPYGFPCRFFPDIFLLIDNGVMFITVPKPYVNILNGITATHLTVYFGESNPSKEVILNKIIEYGLCHWRQVSLISIIDLKSVWRFSLEVKKVKATDYTGVRNR